MPTLADLTPYTAELPATKAGNRRDVLWYPDTRSIRLTCDAAFVVREDGRKEPDAYGCDEFPADAPGRAFSVRKLTGDRQDGRVYCVFLGTPGVMEADCTCRGGSYRRAGVGECRHLCVVRTAVSKGWIKPLPEVEPYDMDGYTDDELETLAAEFEEDERLARGGVLRVA